MPSYKTETVDGQEIIETSKGILPEIKHEEVHINLNLQINLNT